MPCHLTLDDVLHTLFRITSIPRSFEAFSSRTRARRSSGLRSIQHVIASHRHIHAWSHQLTRVMQHIRAVHMLLTHTTYVPQPRWWMFCQYRVDHRTGDGEASTCPCNMMTCMCKTFDVQHMCSTCCRNTCSSATCLSACLISTQPSMCDVLHFLW